MVALFRLLKNLLEAYYALTPTGLLCPMVKTTFDPSIWTIPRHCDGLLLMVSCLRPSTKCGPAISNWLKNESKQYRQELCELSSFLSIRPALVYRTSLRQGYGQGLKTYPA